MELTLNCANSAVWTTHPIVRSIEGFRKGLPSAAPRQEKELLSMCPLSLKTIGLNEKNPTQRSAGKVTEAEPVLSSYLMQSYQQYETA